MKKLFIFAFLACAIGVYAQQIDKSKYRSSTKFSPSTEIASINQDEAGPLPFAKKIIAPAITKSTDFINPIEIGQAGNAWGFLYMRTTFLWAVNDINSISFMHRMTNPPGTGYLAYDISTDGGQTWSVNNQVYDPTLAGASNGRYPQGVLYNPAGNTDPNNAYFNYFAPTLDNSNPSGANTWGGYSWGSKKIAAGSLPTQHNLASTAEFRQYLPSGMTLTQLGEMWITDEETEDVAGSYAYTGNLIVGHGLWNETNEEFDYTFDHLPLEINPEDGINDVKVAFAPDGMTGYICAMSDRIPALPYTSYHPILFKTTDGGQTWSEDPIEIQLGGDDGLEAIWEFISDEDLAEFFDPQPVPPREEIMYYMGYHMDLAVDAWGNPHISGLVAIADPDGSGWYHYEGVMAMFHFWSTDQGETWDAFNLDYIKTFDAEWVGTSGSTASMNNRPQVATTSDGAIVFFSWLDTRIDGIEENSQPDIFFREYFPTMEMHGEEVVNVTDMSAAMWTARWGCMSHYVFSENTGDEYDCTIPFAYQEMENDDPSLPTQFWYIPDFQRSYVITDIADNDVESITSISQNFPNPCRDFTQININLVRNENVSVDIYNLTGQKVRSFAFGRLGNGPHQLNLDINGFDSGVYFYTLRAGESDQTRKMIVN